MARTLEGMAVKRADGVVCLTRYTEERVRAAGARSTRVIPNAVDAAFYTVENRPEAGLALCVAGIHPWKRQVELMEALDTLPANRRPRLVFLGALPASSYGEAFRRALDARRDWCEHAGEVDRAGLRAWLARGALLVLPSIEDNCPMVALEAMAAGVPVAASAIGGIPDLVVPEETGLLFNPHDPSSIVSSVSRLLHDDPFGASCRRGSRVRSHLFHPLPIAEQHLELYLDHRTKTLKHESGTGRNSAV
jgi:glycosyltransferase involved in cell wall biosynthesis